MKGMDEWVWVVLHRHAIKAKVLTIIMQVAVHAVCRVTFML